MRQGFLIFLLLCAAAFGIAQTQLQKQQWIVPGRYLIRDMSGTPLMLTTRQGLFMLNKGVLAKLDPVTLQQQGTVELFGPLADLPREADLTPQTYWDIIAERACRLLPAAITQQGDNLIMLVGDHFARVDPTTMKVAVNKALVENETQLGHVDNLVFQPAPVLAFSGTTLYVVRGGGMPFGNAPKMQAVDTTTGAVLAEKPLPSQLTPGPETLIPPPGGINFEGWNVLWQQPSVNYLATDQGVFVLRSGALAKLDPHTLEPVKVTELLGPITTVAADAANEEKAAASVDRARRILPGVLLVKGNDLLVLIGDHFFRVNTETLQIEKQATLADTKADALKQRMEWLIACGQPQVRLAAAGLLVARGKEVLAVNPDDGSTRMLALPEAMTQPLSAVSQNIPRVYKTRAPEEGAKVSLSGPLWKETTPDGDIWMLYSDEYGGDIVLTGDRLTKITQAPKAEGSQAMVEGIFKAQRPDVPQRGLGSIEISGNPQVSEVYPLPQAVVHKRTLPEGDVWTVTGPYEGSEFVLRGAKADELTATLGIEGRPVFLLGKFVKENDKELAVGRGYFEVQTYSIPPRQEDIAAKQDVIRSAAIATTDTSIYVARNGMLACFDAKTLEQLGLQTLVPAPALGDNEALSDEQMQALLANHQARTETLRLMPFGANLLVVSPAAGFTCLDAATLEVKTRMKPNAFPGITLDPAKCLPMGDKLIVSDKMKIITINAADGQIAIEEELPASLTNRIFPDPSAEIKKK